MKYYNTVMVSVLLSACAIDPVSSNNYEGLGSTKVGVQLRYSMFLGESAVDNSISQLVNSSTFNSLEERRVALKNLGFECKPISEKVCTYDGSAISKLFDKNGKGKKTIKTNVHIDASVVDKMVAIKSIINRELY